MKVEGTEGMVYKVQIPAGLVFFPEDDDEFFQQLIAALALPMTPALAASTPAVLTPAALDSS